MPKGPQGQKRKADVIGNAVLIAIATGEASDDAPEAPAPSEALWTDRIAVATPAWACSIE